MHLNPSPEHNHLKMKKSPLPSLSWANGAEIWKSMLEKDLNYSKLRSHKMLERHPTIFESYRTILFDWISEVSHECKFHRETYHLALDFIDRYLSCQSNVEKSQLQLIGVTCLFLAAKFEEIRPPSVSEFADLTDGACKPEDIIGNEINILSAINWEITPVTPNNWLDTYIHQADCCNISNHKRIASVIDLALLHIESLRFTNSTLTASALYYFTDDQTVYRCTGFQYRDLASCIRWLEPFVETIKEFWEPVFLASCKGENQSTQLHSHTATAKLLDKVISKMTTVTNVVETPVKTSKRKLCTLSDEDDTDSETDGQLSPSKPTTLLTPPRSVRKSRRIR